MTTKELIIFVNGRQVSTHGWEPSSTLLSFLRKGLGLTGTKDNCYEGCTGACTVMITHWNSRKCQYVHRAAVSCAMPLAALHRCQVTTVEGLGTSRNPHKIQQRLNDCHAIQCGYDTPGLVMAVYAMLVQYTSVTMEDIIREVSGNLSRCNGYRAVIEALKEFADKPSEEREPFEKNLSEELKVEEQYPIRFVGKDKKPVWMTIDQVAEAKQFLKPEQKLEYGVPYFPKGMVIAVKQNDDVVISDENVTVCSNCTLTEMIEALRAYETDVEQVNMRKMKLAGLLESFGTSSWRNTTSLMDTLNSKEMKIVLKLLVSHMTIIQENGIEKKVVTYGSLGDVLKMESMGSSFRVLANIEDVLKENLVISLTINWPSENEYINLAKSSLRRAVCVPKVITAIRAKTDSNKTVEAVILLIIDEDGKEVSTTNTVAAIKGKVLDESLPDKLAPALAQDFADISSKSKKIILTNLVKKTLQTQPVDEDGIKLGEVTSSQVEEYLYGVEADDIKPVGKPFPLAAGLLMASGEASYVDDLPKLDNELYMKFVTGQRGHAKILNVDASKALEMPGVAKFISIADIPEGKNEFATFGDKDANVFADGEVLYWGHPVGAILADTAEIATKAASLVEIEYEDLPVIVTIQDAIKAESFYANPEFFETAFTDGDAKKVIDESPHIIEGSFQTPRQEHFYEETYNLLAVPQEDGEMKVYTSSQFVTGIHLGLANILGVPANRITIICKRIGCSYGGKCFRNYGFVFAGALAAQVSGRPVRCVLNREEDMQQSGQRGEFEAKYRVGVDNDGKLTGLEYNLWKNGGWCSDCSVNILEYALFHGTNCYKFPTFKGVGKVCKTNTPSNTAFRGYGSPQGLTITENIMFEIAEHLDLDPVEFRRKNFLVVGDKTHYGQIQKEDDVTMEACMDECIRKSQYHLSKEAVDQFNSTNKHRKRGICLIPQKYGVGIVPMFAQAGALINVHLDGSVNLYVGGVEMGNGFYTKMVQVASNELGIPMSKIHITESGTDKVPNPHMSGASSSSDLSGPAVIKACRELMARLAPVKEANPGATWEQLAGAAWATRVNLSVAAHYAQDQAWTGWTGASKEEGYKKEGDRWAYWVTSATCITVEIDVLTGEHKMLSAHVVMDLGEVINPGIDTVQIEGGFLQGYGYLTMESCDFAPDGKLLSVGPNTYTIPSIADIPPVFEVSLLRKETPEVHQRPLYTSKAVGEQGLYTGCTVYFAIKAAVMAARKERGLSGSFDLLTPTTPANVIDAIYNAKLRVHGLTS